MTDCNDFEEASDILRKAVLSILGEDFLQNPSAESQGAVKTAHSILQWVKVPENAKLFEVFALELVDSLQQCFKCYGRSRSLRKKQEKMWGAFHGIRTSDNFIKDWESFLTNIDATFSPVFYQHITDFVFEELIKIKHPFQSPEQCGTTNNITEMEENALRYVGGYVLRNVKTMLEKSENPHKETFLFSIAEMIGGENIDGRASQWVRDIDRGGLYNINDETYTCFYIMEEHTREYFKINRISEMTDGFKDSIIEDIVSSSDLTTQWSVALGTSFNDEHTLELLKMIVTLYITIRGFAFAKSCVELYKQANKKALSKSKGIRKELYTPSV